MAGGGGGGGVEAGEGRKVSCSFRSCEEMHKLGGSP